MAENKPSTDITNLVAQLEQETNALKDAQKAESIARGRVTDKQNSVNEVQKKLDAAFEALRAEAPHSTDWHSRRVHRALGALGE